MKITLHTNDGKRLAAIVPYPNAPAVKVSRVCDCGCQAIRCLRVDTETRDTIAGDADCGGCGKPVGRLVVTFSTIFGIEEDSRVANGRSRVY